MCGPHPRSTPFREGRERLIFAFCVCFVYKVQGQGPARGRSRRRWNFAGFFSEFFGWGRTLADASQPNSFPNPTATDQFRSVKERRRPDSSEECRYQCGIRYEAECAELTE